MIVKNAQDVFEFMKECHLHDASNRNNYPVVTCWNEWVGFRKQRYVIIDNEKFFSPNIQDCDSPDYYEEGKMMYKKWKKKLECVIPAFRRHREQQEKDAKEKKEFERLKAKFN